MFFSRLHLLALAAIPVVFIYFSGRLFLDASFYQRFRIWLPVDVIRGIGFFLGGIGFIILRQALRDVPIDFTSNLSDDKNGEYAFKRPSDLFTRLMLLFFIPGMSLFLGFYAFKDSLVLGKNRVSYTGPGARAMGITMILVGLFAAYSLRKNIKEVIGCVLKGFGIYKSDCPVPGNVAISAKAFKIRKKPTKLKRAKTSKPRRRKE